ncbi:MAG: hypothetical protein IIT88_00610 [Acetobacter sp.]|nr:hypothetical protein [Acetobacter sp.]
MENFLKGFFVIIGCFVLGMILAPILGPIIGGMIALVVGLFLFVKTVLLGLGALFTLLTNFLQSPAGQITQKVGEEVLKEVKKIEK